MPRNGSGSFSLVSGNPVVPSTVISSTWANNTLSDIGTAITQSIAYDGQTAPVANLPMSTFRHTNVGNAAARNEYAAYGQVQDGQPEWLTSVSGVDTITASIAPGPSAYTAGQCFRFVSAGANTTAVTLNINGLGAKAVTKRGSTALVAGDIPSGAVIEAVYDGTRFQMVAIPKGTYLGTQVFTASGTYTPSAGASIAVVTAVGGGGAGGGSPATGAGQLSIGSGGNAGAIGKLLVTSGLTTTTVTIGAGGTGVSAANGNAGTSTSFGALLVCAGGAGGVAAGPSGPPFIGAASTSLAAVTGSGTILYRATGNQGAHAIAISTSALSQISGKGAGTMFGEGGVPAVASGSGGSASANSGSGGAGAFSGASQPAFAGGNGAAGILLVDEYA